MRDHYAIAHAVKKSTLISLTRRDFLKTTAVGTAALTVPLIIPSRLLGADAPGNRVRVGQIGCGRIATVHDMPGVSRDRKYAEAEWTGAKFW